jgi:hypothetical protein
MRRLLDRQADGLAAWLHFDPADGAIAIEHVQDVDAILAANKAAANARDGFSASRELREIAEIPAIVVLLWRDEGVDIFDRNHWPEVKRRLSDPDWRWLRTSPGAI